MIKLFGIYISKAVVLLAVAEVLIFFSSMHGAILLFHQIANQTISSLESNIPVIFSLVLFSAMTALGLYQKGSMATSSGFLLRIILAFLVGGVAMLLLLVVAPIFVDNGQSVLSYGLALSLLGILVARTIFVRVTSDKILKRRVLVLGVGINADRIEESMRDKDTLGIVVVAYVNLGDRIELIDKDRQIVKDQSLLEISNRLAVDEIVVAVDDRRKKLPNHELLECKIKGIRILDLLTFFEKELSIINIDLLYPSWMLYTDGYRQRALNRTIKKAFDMSVGIIIFLFAAPLMVLVTIASLIESGGRDPILYSQVRVGKNGKLFKVYKFRSMRTDAEADGVARWATKNDARITKLGGFLRKTRLDELPQIYNILNGDMSLVGPRPERPEFVMQLSNDIPYYPQRHWVKPGLTGWAQMLYPYGASEEDAKRKLEYDLYYVKNASTMLDFIILLQTIEVVLLGKGAQ
ncbi:MAG: TIGR03013 family PEP-CTERM/XrtA system glycosyltransferase [Candidatus Thiodiazotropha lotti]|uniref:TIGR03013 family PEP-CTERM/XrtA system glycosyltransferase n=1 Tax=Candidatus Thiodiazotropha lotti TaxID=2792787 RepID=A0A9E4K4K7_9GAMM|nr:TIGR03013 family PEP-CTERM/XrtA system glycosyltransferase [Candidatus Thiodiazotropha lotti]MCG7938798.1 TIGR03013 family PEP-CTERM/XrtA system glycosyltransferase [Candidatus Thiodiazotropha lotti]MCW4203270.1 TIGR03013 family PEP-CTERM/XrtA system glycosyltransferase [Candidatus Thiodiazotropha lotti]ODB99629.1 glycosyl transferase [Candidatus Thiodiazotropha endoloripes]